MALPIPVQATKRHAGTINTAFHSQGHQHITCAGCGIWDRKKPPLFSGHYLRNRSTLDIGVLGYIVIPYYKEHSPEVWHIHPGTFCIYCILAGLRVTVGTRHCA